MPPPYCYDYPRPSVTVDMVVFKWDGEHLRVLLIRRERDPYAGRWALPGGFLDIEEPMEAGARRELAEETGLDLATPPAFLGVYGAPGRDPRGRTFSLAHAAVVRDPLPEVKGGDDAAEAAWIATKEARAGGLAFDHDSILDDATRWLATGIDAGELGLPLLPAEFDDAAAIALFRAVGGTTGAARKMLRHVERRGLIQKEPGPGRRYRQVPERGHPGVKA